MSVHTTQLETPANNGFVSTFAIDTSLTLGVCSVIAGSYYFYGVYKKYQDSKCESKEALLQKWNEDSETARMSQILNKFSIDEITPDVSTFYSRLCYFLNMTDPKYYLLSDKKIEEAISTVRKYKDMAKDSDSGILYITADEKNTIITSAKIMSSSANDVGDIVSYPFRMCGFVYTNLPVVCGVLLAPPTMFYTILFQWINQSYNAGLNYGNKNSTCKYTTKDILGGYLTAVFSAITVAIVMRLSTEKLAAESKGVQLMLINTIVACVSGAVASFCNTTFMRRAEVVKGIQVCSDKELTNVVGISCLAAKSAVKETAFTRSIMSILGFCLPLMFVEMFALFGIHPASSNGTIIVEVLSTLISLRINLAISVSIFAPVSNKKGSDCEPEFSEYETLYYSKGL